VLASRAVITSTAVIRGIFTDFGGVVRTLQSIVRYIDLTFKLAPAVIN
jgi:hypothetical protein